MFGKYYAARLCELMLNFQDLQLSKLNDCSKIEEWRFSLILILKASVHFYGNAAAL